MSSIEQCVSNIQNYYDLEEKIKAIIKKINAAKGDSSNLAFHINNNYQVNGDGAAVATRATDLKRKLAETEDYLRSVVLPSISTSISEEQFEKARLEAEEENS